MSEPVAASTYEALYNEFFRVRDERDAAIARATEAEAERDELRRLRALDAAVIEGLNRRLSEWRRYKIGEGAEAAEAQVAKLREALAPFAAAWADTINVFDRNTKTLGVFGAVCGYHVSGADYRRAHQEFNATAGKEPAHD